jgi:uncharacterized glyoxalase superfamily protein PhnB
MKDALDFYTRILDFKLKYAEASVNDWVVDLVNEEAELQLTVLESDNLYGSVVNVWVEDIDSLFNKYVQRGLDTSNKKNSPVHQGPLDQTWGTREFYVTDHDGNTLRFCRSL